MPSMSRTTLSLDDDVLDAARAIAARDDRAIGEVVSDLARQSLSRRRPKRNRLGLPLLPSSGERRKVTLAMVNRLRDELP